MKHKIEAVSRWIGEYVYHAGAQGVVIGLSGGVDSSVIAALSVKALGADKVCALSLPCNSDRKDIEDARRVAAHLKIADFGVCSLHEIYEGILGLLRIEGAEKTMVGANVKARLRMVALYAEANDKNYLVIGTGNKSELKIGYVTKWGDGAVDFEPLGEFYKREVVGMARELGLPEDICTRTPSPGLQPGVTDESEIGVTYDEIEQILRWQEEGGTTPGVRTESFVRMEMLMEKNQHKMRMPPVYPRPRGDQG